MEKLSIVQRVQIASLTVVTAHIQIQEQKLSEAATSFGQAIAILEDVSNEDSDYASLLNSLKEEYSSVLNRVERNQN